MFKKSVYRVGVGLAVLLLVQLGCSLVNFLPAGAPQVDEAETETEVPAPPTEDLSSQVEATAVPGKTLLAPYVYAGRVPESGMGGLFGRLLWNDAPVEGVQVKLCEEMGYFDGCSGQIFDAETGPDGAYLFLDLPPGSYGLTYSAIDSDTWYFVTEGVMTAKMFEVSAGEMLDAGDNLTNRTDVRILTPRERERVIEKRPTLSWEAYPGAAYYELNLSADRGGSLIYQMQLDGTSFALDRDLQNCNYSMYVNAFNNYGTLIAETLEYRNFEVIEQEENCKMRALAPADGSSVPGNNIVLKWQAHGWASSYKINMYSDSDINQVILDFVTSANTEYTITQNVPPGRYIWVVYAYNEYGDGLGFTDQFTLNVTAP